MDKRAAAAAVDIALAAALFEALEDRTRDVAGVTRDSYGPGEQAAHDLVTEAAAALGLTTSRDHALNLYMTLPGTDRTAPRLMIGSHLDSVNRGGNFDGAAGVLAGLAVVAGFRKAGFTPPCDITVMAVRAEEAVWFDAPYIGSRAALGLLRAEELSVQRSDSQRALSAHLAEAGGDLEAVRRGQAELDPAAIRAFLEVHIEQAPSLVAAGIPVGVVTGIRGDFRYRNARAVGEWGHSGALARAQRRDAVVATMELVQALQAEWLRREAAGEDLVFTVGELTTDPLMHGPSKVAGETRFTLDFRSLSEPVMREMGAFALEEARRIEAGSGVRLDLGAPSYCDPALMAPEIQDGFARAARDLDIPVLEMASGAGHDAAVFAGAGVPSGMLFIRNDGGSHNPGETMAIEDFGAACRVLAGYLADSFGV